MAEAQLIPNPNKFKHIYITVNDNISFAVYPDIISIKQKDLTGKSKTCTISKANWFKLIEFSQIIQNCFLINQSQFCHDNYIENISTQSKNENISTQSKKIMERLVYPKGKIFIQSKKCIEYINTMKK